MTCNVSNTLAAYIYQVLSGLIGCFKIINNYLITGKILAYPVKKKPKGY